MFRALSVRVRRGGYDKLADDDDDDGVESTTSRDQVELSRSRSAPAKILLGGRSSKKPTDQNATAKSVSKQVAKRASKIHPLFNLFDTRLRKKATAKPEFSRYLQYLKEGGFWDTNSNAPVIYYK